MSTRLNLSKDLLFVALALICCTRAIAGGGGGDSGYSQHYLTSVERNQPEPKVFAWSRLDVTSFRVNSVGKQYKLLPVVLVNHSDKPVSLSATQDKVAVVTSSGVATLTTLQISKLDRALWDSWDTATHNMIEYPESIEPGISRVIYVLVPRSKLEDVPFGIDVTIASSGMTMKLRQPPAMAD